MQRYYAPRGAIRRGRMYVRARAARVSSKLADKTRGRGGSSRRVLDYRELPDVTRACISEDARATFFVLSLMRWCVLQAFGRVQASVG